MSDSNRITEPTERCRVQDPGQLHLTIKRGSMAQQQQIIKEEAPSEKFPQNLPAGWKSLLADEVHQDYFKNLLKFLNAEFRQGKSIYPARQNIMRALQTVDYDQVRVVILGQDPYHGKDQAVGLCFAVANEIFPKPPSLLNIYQELKADLGCNIDRKISDLTGWAQQGVFLLNTVLTVRSGEAFSHRNKGWEIFTDKIIRLLSQRTKPIVFILWGAAAQQKKALIGKQHFILESAHPSPLSAHRGFLGSRPFSKANQFLTENLQEEPIDWSRICS